MSVEGVTNLGLWVDVHSSLVQEVKREERGSGDNEEEE